MSKEFKDLKEKFSEVISSNEQLSNDLKASASLRCELSKAKEENDKLFKKVLKLKNSIFKFHKRKKTFNTLLTF